MDFCFKQLRACWEMRDLPNVRLEICFVLVIRLENRCSHLNFIQVWPKAFGWRAQPADGVHGSTSGFVCGVSFPCWPPEAGQAGVGYFNCQIRSFLLGVSAPHQVQSDKQAADERFDSQNCQVTKHVHDQFCFKVCLQSFSPS